MEQLRGGMYISEKTAFVVFPDADHGSIHYAFGLANLQDFISKLSQLAEALEDELAKD